MSVRISRPFWYQWCLGHVRGPGAREHCDTARPEQPANRQCPADSLTVDAIPHSRKGPPKSATRGRGVCPISFLDLSKHGGPLTRLSPMSVTGVVIRYGGGPCSHARCDAESGRQFRQGYSAASDFCFSGRPRRSHTCSSASASWSIRPSSW
jgi:hypothetical protein